MSRAQRSEAAQRDLESIAFQIALRDRRPSTADRIIDELIDQCDELARLAQTAVLGTAAPEIGEDVRLFPYKRWVILFRYAPHGVHILRSPKRLIPVLSLEDALAALKRSKWKISGAGAAVGDQAQFNAVEPSCRAHYSNLIYETPVKSSWRREFTHFDEIRRRMVYCERNTNGN